MSSRSGGDQRRRGALPTTGFTVHRRALEAAGLAMRLVSRVPAPYRSLADQVIRSASSVPANLAEGHDLAPPASQGRVTTGDTAHCR